MSIEATTADPGWHPQGWSPRVWAPTARSVTVQHGRALTSHEPMAAGSDGWWQLPSGTVLPHGADYAFDVDGSGPLPDPRSAWQPSGVHGPSRVFDSRRHEWTDGDWLGRDVRGSVGYELHIGTFTPEGTLDTAVDRLGHLADLGVQMIELMPVAAFPGTRGWGYDGVALYAVHEAYGGPAALQRFVDAAHRRGLAVALDVVYNHLGPSGNYLGRFGPYFTETHQTPWGSAVNLDAPGSEGTRAFLIDNALRWLRDFHLDALRLDAVHALADDSPRHLLAELSERVEELAREVGRPLSLVAESDLNDPAMVTPRIDGGLGMTAQWADDVHHALHAWVTGERHGYYGDFGTTETLAHAMTRVFVHDGRWSTFRGKKWGRPVPPSVDGRRFVVFSANHDQVGNRALGDRPSARLDPAHLAVSAAAVLCSPFTPMLFMGQEWGARTPFQYFTEHSEADLIEGIRRGRTEEFAGHGWAELYGGPVHVPDPQAASTFTDSRLDWSEMAREPHARLLSWYRTLIALRDREPDLSSGDLSAVHTVPGDDRLVFGRGDLRIVLHIGTGPTSIRLDAPHDVGSPIALEVVASWDPVVVRDGLLDLPGPGATIVRVENLVPDEEWRPSSGDRELPRA